MTQNKDLAEEDKFRIQFVLMSEEERNPSIAILHGGGPEKDKYQTVWIVQLIPVGE